MRRTSFANLSGTSRGPELLIALRTEPGAGSRRGQLERRLRELVRDGTLPAESRLPSSRALAGDIGVSRRLVVEAYAQLLAEGYLVSRPGAGTFVAATAADRPHGNAPAPRSAAAPAYHFFPGAPALDCFPRTQWLRAMRETIGAIPAAELSYPDPRGAPALRAALASHLRRVRGVIAEPDAIVICSGATQALALLAGVLAREGTQAIDVENPSLPAHRAVLAQAGLAVRGVAVDEAGLCVADLRSPAVLATPAHQFPTGVALSPDRRRALLAWAREGRLVIEDDYDAELRYDRAPVGALQGLAPEHVAYIGTASKTLAPGLRLGWLVLPARLREPVAQAKLLADFGCPVLEQHTLARLIETSTYDRLLRRARRSNRARRDALVSAVQKHLPGAQVSGIAAGLHAVLRLPDGPTQTSALLAAAARRSVGVHPLQAHMLEPGPQTDALVLGYACLSEPAIEQGVRLLAEAVREATENRPERSTCR